MCCTPADSLVWRCDLCPRAAWQNSSHMTAVPRLVQERATSTILSISQDMYCSSGKLLLHACMGTQHMVDRCMALGAAAVPPSDWRPLGSSRHTLSTSGGSWVCRSGSSSAGTVVTRKPQCEWVLNHPQPRCQQSWYPASASLQTHVAAGVSTRQPEPSLVLQRL